MPGEQVTTWARTGSQPNRGAQLAPAVAVWNTYMDLKYENIGINHLVGENYLSLFTDFCSKIGENPPMKTNRIPYEISSLQKYVRTLINDLKKKFGNHELLRSGFFEDNDVRQMLNSMSSNHGRTLMIGSKESDVFKDSFPIPSKHSHQTRILPFNDFPDELQRSLSRSVDLLSMAKKLFLTQEFVKAAKILCTFNGIGRGGEVKFLSYEKMFFCGQFNILFLQWFQRKELKTNPSGFCIHFEHPELCVFFILGCYWSISNGLSRNANHLVDPNSPLYKRAKFVFPDLHEITDASVAGQLTTIIRSLVPDQIKSFYSVKSLRTGAMSQLQWNPAVIWQEGVALGGWKTGANSDWYVWMYLVAIIPPVLALSGYPQPRTIPNLPDITVLFHDTDPTKILNANLFPEFLNSLFVISLPEFRGPHGRLHNLLLTVTAVMIKNFRYCERTYGSGHSFVKKMLSATVDSGLASNTIEASNKLKTWSSKISTALNNQNIQQHGPIIAQQGISEQMSLMNHNVAELLRTINGLHNKVDAQGSELIALRQEVQDIRTDQQRNAGHLPDITSGIEEISRVLQTLRLDGPLTGQQSVAAHNDRQQNQQNPRQPLLDLQGNLLQQQEQQPRSQLQRSQPHSQQQPNSRQQPQQMQLQQPENTQLQQAQRAQQSQPQQAQREQPENTQLQQAQRAQQSQPQQAQREQQPQSQRSQVRTAGQVTQPQHARNNQMNLPRTRIQDSTSSGKGKSKLEFTIPNIMLDLYDESIFRKLNNDPNLESLWQHINIKFFQSERRYKYPLIAALQLVDSLWTREERRKSIKKEFETRDEALTSYRSIGDLVKRAVHILSKPDRVTCDNRRKSAIIGVGNAIKKFAGAEAKVKSKIPIWRANQHLEVSMRDYIVSEENKIRNRKRVMGRNSI